MPVKKIIPSEATIEDLKIREKRGISSNRYNVHIYVPLTWVTNPQEGVGINPTNLVPLDLKTLAFYSASINVEKVNKASVLLDFEVAGTYLERFYNSLVQAPEGVEIKIS